jgi:proline iminopeptidase
MSIKAVFGYKGNTIKYLKLISLYIVFPCVIATALGLATVWLVRDQHLEMVKTANTIYNPAGIDDLKAIELGGIRQWIHVRGQDRDNPILLYLHGGPGWPRIGTTVEMQRPWEDYFTVVQWDQRHAGKSYYPLSNLGNSMNREQFVQDAIELVNYMRDTYNQEKIFVLGHSWGSYLGMRLIKERPDWVYAYVGLGQVVSGLENEKAVYERALYQADRTGNQSILEKLEAMAPYPNPKNDLETKLASLGAVRLYLSELSGENMFHYMPPMDFYGLIAYKALISPQLTLRDIQNRRNSDPSIAALMKDFEEFDLPKETGSTFKVPILFFNGRHDFQTSSQLSAEWFEKIEAPYKELIWFEESAHMATYEEPGRFLVALVEKVLPFADTQEKS